MHVPMFMVCTNSQIYTHIYAPMTQGHSELCCLQNISPRKGTAYEFLQHSPVLNTNGYVSIPFCPASTGLTFTHNPSESTFPRDILFCIWFQKMDSSCSDDKLITATTRWSQDEMPVSKELLWTVLYKRAFRLEYARHFRIVRVR